MYIIQYIQVESIHIYVHVHVAGILYTTYMYMFCTLNFRVMSTFRVSGDGQALFMPSESEMQRLCVPKKDRYCTFFLLFIRIFKKCLTFDNEKIQFFVCREHS